MRSARERRFRLRSHEAGARVWGAARREGAHGERLHRIGGSAATAGSAGAAARFRPALAQNELCTSRGVRVLNGRGEAKALAVVQKRRPPARIHPAGCSSRMKAANPPTAQAILDQSLYSGALRRTRPGRTTRISEVRRSPCMSSGSCGRRMIPMARSTAKRYRSPMIRAGKKPGPGGSVSGATVMVSCPTSRWVAKAARISGKTSPDLPTHQDCSPMGTLVVSGAG